MAIKMAFKDLNTFKLISDLGENMLLIINYSSILRLRYINYQYTYTHIYFFF
jgi:hypothetical protein